MSVGYRGLKPILCIQELDLFGYTPLSASLKPSHLSPYVCVRVKILSIFNNNNNNKKLESFNYLDRC